MKIICKDKTVDTDHFEKIQCRESIVGGSFGFPVELVRKEQSNLYLVGVVLIEEEILRFRDVDSARQLVDAITKDWIAGAKSFDVEKWVIATQMEPSLMRDRGNYYEEVYRDNKLQMDELTGQ